MAVNFWRAWWAWVICFGTTVLVSLSTKPRSQDDLHGLVIGLTPAVGTADVPLLKRPEFFAVISLIVLVLLNVYFW
jgi:SSS family solute:Na+ symporter